MDRQAQFLQRYLALACENLFREAYVDKIRQIASENPEVVESVMSEGDDDPEPCRVILQALLLENDGAPAPARAQLADLVAILNEDTDTAAAAYFHYGRLLRKNSEWPEAVVQLNRAAQLLRRDLRKVPEDETLRQALERVYRELAQAHWQQENPQAAARIYRRLLELAPEDLPLRLQIAREVEELDLLDLAAEQYRHVAETGDPQQRTRAYQELARLELVRDNLEESAAALEAALDLIGPRHWLRGDLLRKLIQVQKSRGALEKLGGDLQATHDQAPRDLGALQDLLTYHEETGNLEEQLAIQEKIADLQPGNPAQRLRLAQLAEKTGNIDRAREILRQLREQAPEDWAVLFALAALELREGNRETATDLMREVREARPGDTALMSQVEQWLGENRLDAALEEHLRALIARAPHQEGPAFRLAEFLAANGRADEAVKIIDPLVEHSTSALRRAALQHQFGRILQKHGALKTGLNAMRAAVQQDPGHLPYQLALAELLKEADALGAARDQLLTLLDAAQTGGADPGLIDKADRLLFEVLRVMSDESEEEPTPLDRRLQALNDEAAASEQVKDKLRAARWLVWSGRSGFSLPLLREILREDPRNAEAQQLLLQELPDLQEDMQGATDVLQGVVDNLRAAGDAVPVEFLRQLGQLQMARENTAQALELFREALRRDPRNVQRLVDLAVAQQRAGLWYEALDSWKKAYDLTGPGAQQAILRPYLAALERLQLNKRARDLLDNALQAAGSEDEKLAIADEMIAFEKRNEMLDALRRRIERKLTEQPNNTFLRQFIARVYQVQGQETEAAGVLQDVAALAENPAAILMRLASRAAESGETETAIDYLREAVKVEPSEATYRRLADLLEESYRYEEAWQAWEDLLALSSPGPQVLLDAAAFCRRVGYLEKARELLGRIVHLQPDSVNAHLDLARLEEWKGHLDTAINHYREVLRLTRQQSHSGGEDGRGHYPPLELPAEQDVQHVLGRALETFQNVVSLDVREDLKLFWRQDRIWNDNNVATYTPRFVAIRQLGRLMRRREITHPEEYRKWVARWIQSGSFAERLWAYYYTREHRELWLHLLPLSQPGEDGSLSPYSAQTFLWFNLDGGNADRLVDWIAESEGAQRRDRERHFLTALGQYLPSQLWAGQDVFELTNLLTTGEFSHEALRAAAVLYLQNGQFSASADLLKNARQTAPAHEQGSYAVRAAETYLMGGRRQEAAAMVDSILERPEHQTLENFAKAVRIAVLLQSPDTAGEVGDRLRRMDAASIPPTHRSLGLALLGGLENEPEQAAGHLQEFLQLQPRRWDSFSTQPYQLSTSSAADSFAYWNTITRAGFMFLSWNLPDLTRQLWSQALNKAHRQAQEDQETQERIQLMHRLLVALRIWENPQVADHPLLKAYVARENTSQVWELIDHLEDQQLLPQVISLTKSAREFLPEDPVALERKLFELYLDRGEFAQARDMIHAAEGREAGDGGEAHGQYRQWSLALAKAYMGSGQYWQALDVYRTVFPESITDLGAVQNIIWLADQMQLDELAITYCEAFIRQDQDRPEVYAQWARNMQNAGRTQEALERLNTVFPANHDGRAQILPSLFNLNMAAGKTEQAVEIAREIVQLDYPLSMLQELVQALEEAGSHERAQELLKLALRQQQSPSYLLKAEEMLVTRLMAQTDDPASPELQPRLRHLETLLRQTGETHPQALRLLARAAAQPDVLPWLRDRWMPGYGSPPGPDREPDALQALLQIFLRLEQAASSSSATPAAEHDTALAALVERFAQRRFTRRNAADHPQGELLKRLGETPELASLLQVALQKMAEAYPENLQYQNQLALLLQDQNEPEMALEVLRGIELRGIVETPDFWQVGLLYERLGYPERARQIFERTVPNQRIAQLSDVTACWIRGLCGTPRREQARRVLTAYYLSGKETDMEPLLSWLACPEARADWRELSRDLNLSDRQRVRLQLHLFRQAVQNQDMALGRDLLDHGAAQYLIDPHLMQSAAELFPGHFALAKHLARFLSEQKRWADAATIMQRYLTATSPEPNDEITPKNHAEARQLLEEYQQNAGALPEDS